MDSHLVQQSVQGGNVAASNTDFNAYFSTTTGNLNIVEQFIGPVARPKPTAEEELKKHCFTSTESCFPEILKSFQLRSDVKIVCKSGRSCQDGFEVISTSSVLLSMSSDYLKNVLEETIQSPSWNNEDDFVIHLKDFDSFSILGMIDYMLHGFSNCQGANQYQQLLQLLTILEFKGCQRANGCSPSEEWQQAATTVKDEPEVTICYDCDGHVDLPADDSRSSRDSGPPKKKARKTKRKAKRKESETVDFYWKDDEEEEEMSPADISACDVCGHPTDSLECTTRHILETLGDENAMSLPRVLVKPSGKCCCPVCQRRCHTLTTLRIHLKVHMAEAHERVKRCPQCGRLFDTVKNYFLHLPKHSARRSMETQERECPICRKTFALRTWYNHKKCCERQANQDFLLCDICGFKTVHADVLRSHHGSFHGGEKKFKCLECDKSYYKRYRLDIHMREHTGTFTFMCDICAKGFNRIDSLNKHKKHVHAKIYLFQCLLCSEKFKNRAAISRHVIIHSDLEPFQCSACNQRFKVNAAAYTHKLKVHNNQAKVLIRGGDELVNLKKKLIKKIEPEAIETGRKFLRYKGFPTIEDFVGGVKDDDDDQIQMMDRL